MKDLSRNVHRTKIGYISSGKFVPKIYFNFELNLYVSNNNIKVRFQIFYLTSVINLYVLFLALYKSLPSLTYNLIFFCRVKFSLLNLFFFYVLILLLNIRWSSLLWTMFVLVVCVQIRLFQVQNSTSKCPNVII